MSESSNQRSSAGTPDPSDATQSGGQSGLLFASAILVTAFVAIVGGYAIQTGVFVLKALAFQTALAAISAWLCLNACRIRRRLSEAKQLDRTEKPDERQPRWGDAARRQDREAYDVLLADLDHARKLHYLFLAVLPTLAVGSMAAYQLLGQAGSASISQGQGAALGIVCLAVSCLWLVLSRSFGATREADLPESRLLALAFRETQWASILTSGAIIGSLMWSSVDIWLGRVLLVWVVAVCAEQLVRLASFWLRGAAEDGPFIPPLRVVLREAVLVRGNPISSIFETIEARLGVSFRSSWAIQFVKRAALPVLLLAALLFWGLSSLSMVGPSELGVRESFGRISGEPLQPGLHLKLPWPLGRVLRYPVKKVSAKPVGFVIKSGTVNSDQKASDTITAPDQSNATASAEPDFRSPRAYVWSEAHAKEEYPLVLGDGAEVVAVNALVYYKICEDKERFLDYVYHFQNPVAALEGYAYRALMEETRAATLEEVLSANRAKFAQRLEDLLRGYAASNRLGIDVIDVALVNLHPPVETVADYLDVINAQIDADRFQVEATGKRLVRIQTAETDSSSAVATARVDAEKRVGLACEESAQFVAVGKAFSVAPEAFKLRLRGDTIQELLSAKPLILIDKSFTSGRGEMLLDLRPNAQSGDRTTTGVQKR